LQKSKACNTLDNFELWTDEDLTHTVRIPCSYKIVKLALSRYKRIKKRNCEYTFIENSCFCTICFEIYPTLDGIVMSPTLSCSVVWRLIKGAVGYTLGELPSTQPLTLATEMQDLCTTSLYSHLPLPSARPERDRFRRRNYHSRNCNRRSKLRHACLGLKEYDLITILFLY